MSLAKTLKETKRDFIDLEKYPVVENLPDHFGQDNPNLVLFLESYYEYLETTTADQYLRDLNFKREMVSAGDSLLKFFSQELLLGRDYFDKLVDKQTAIQTSNLLYRSKGTHYSIQQFFRIFFGFDVEVRYGKEEVFNVGDPKIETLRYTGEMRDGNLFPGDTLRFTFNDGDTSVWAGRQLPEQETIDAIYVLEGYSQFDRDLNIENDYVTPVAVIDKYNIFKQLRQDIDYNINYDNRAITFLTNDDPVVDDPWINYLAENGEIAEEMPVLVITNRNSPAGTFIGNEKSEKKITDNAYHQMFSLLIRSPVASKRWKEAYKDFVHPAGMYLASEVAVEESVLDLLANQPNASTEAYALDVSSVSKIEERVLAQLTELNIDTYNPAKTSGYSQSGFVTNDRTPYRTVKAFDSAGVPFYTEERVDSQQPDRVYRTRINDITRLPFTMEELDTQYQRMDRIDTIEPRTLDNVEADFSSTINTLDENRWVGKTGNILCADSDGQAQNVLGSVLDFAPEVAGCPGYIFNLFGLFDGPGGGGGPLQGYSSTGQNFNLVTGVASRKFTAYRDERVWGTTVGNNFSDPFNADSSLGFPGDADFANPFQYSLVNGVAANVILYHLSGYIIDSNASPGDSDDYMGAFVKFDDSFGVQTLLRLPDSAP